MSDQNVVKEGWVQKRGEDASAPDRPVQAFSSDYRHVSHLLHPGVNVLLPLELLLPNYKSCRRKMMFLLSRFLLLFLLNDLICFSAAEIIFVEEARF